MNRMFAVSAFTLVLSLAAFGAPITIANLYSTGQNVSGNVDQAWNVGMTTNPTGTAYVTPTNEFPFPNWQTLPGSQWITPQPSYSANQADLQGTWYFATSFTLPGNAAPGSVLVSFRSLVDNNLSDVLVNGQSTAGLFNYYAQSVDGEHGYNSAPGSYTLPSNLFTVGGVNNLVFVVNNLAGTTGNPVGLNVDFTAKTYDLAAVPEPASIGLMATAGALLVLLARRRTRANR